MNTPGSDPEGARVSAQHAANLSMLLALGGLFLFSPIMRLPGGLFLLGLLGCIGLGAGVVARVRRRAAGNGVVHFSGWGMLLSVALIGNAVFAALGLLRF